MDTRRWFLKALFAAPALLLAPRARGRDKPVDLTGFPIYRTTIPVPQGKWHTCVLTGDGRWVKVSGGLLVDVK